MTKFSNIFGKFIGEINTREVARKIFQIYWKIWSCDNQPLPGPSTSRSTTEALGTRLDVVLISAASTSQELQETLEHNFSLISNWYSDNRLTLNVKRRNLFWQVVKIED